MSAICHPPPGGVILLSREPSRDAPRVSFTERGHLRCLLGATFIEATAFLDAHPWQGVRKCLINQPGFQRLTVIGVLGAGGHGSGLHNGPIASQVAAIELGPIPGGRTTTRRLERGEPDFDRVLTHLGRLGPVLAVELDVVDRFRLAESREVLEIHGNAATRERQLSALIRRAIVAQADPRVHSADVWIAPYAQARIVVAALGTRHFTRQSVSAWQRPLALRSAALLQAANVAWNVATALRPGTVPGMLQQAVRMTATRRLVLEARDALDLGAPNRLPMHAIETAIDLDDVARATRAIVTTLAYLEEIATRRSLYVCAPVGIRFVGTTTAAGLSPHAGRRRTMHIEVPTFADPRLRAAEVLAPLQRLFARDFSGRPHWGQGLYLSATELRPMWDDSELRELRAIVARDDPHGVFANPLLDSLLALG
ncbi:MAG: hypothetical protein HOV80_27420 [Polyangiaceae bacterium]|nr:hypothetical protein [Polyangiaceae bacterium]